MFKVMTWNLENLFRPGGSAGPADPDVYKAKLHRLGHAVTAQAPDVLAAREVGDSYALAAPSSPASNSVAGNGPASANDC